MARSGKGRGDPPPAFAFGVDEGEEVVTETPAWDRIWIPVGCILEACLRGSSIGLGTEEWFAVLVTGVSGDHSVGFRVEGAFLGAESLLYEGDIAAGVGAGELHLCPTDPCDLIHETGLIHVTRFRLWRPSRFIADYVVAEGAARLRKAVASEKKSEKPPPAGRPKPGPKASTAKSGAAKKKKSAGDAAEEVPPGVGDDTGAIPVPSDDEEAGDGVNRDRLRGILKRTRERILGQAGPPSRPAAAEGSDGGHRRASAGPAVGERRLVAGTSLNPRGQTPLALAAPEDSRGTGTSGLMKNLKKQGNATSMLLAQAVQSSAQTLKEQKRKKRAQEKDEVGRTLLRLLRDKSGRKNSKRRRSRSRGRHVRMKPDPDDPGGDNGEEDDSGSSSSGSSGGGDRTDEESDASCEAPLRRKAQRSPGSVMSMLIKHAQTQLDRGAMLEAEGSQPGVTTGVKISTYFALLIRPYHAAGSPLLRELYALAQSIDLLRMGRLAETADALASRFISVHTALTDGNWTTASHLELYPLEPVQSASTATMLEAHKHRRLVMKSQGYAPNNRWWGNSGRGKGGGSAEKGKKGNAKDRGRGKGKGGAKDSSWTSKGDANPWKDNKEDASKK